MSALLSLVLAAAADAGTPLLPRALLLGNPSFAAPQLAPDGTRVAFLAPDARNVVQIVVRTLGANDDVALTAEPTRGIRSFRWTEDSSAILYPQDLDGDERFHVFAVDLASRAARDLTPWPKSKSEVLDTSPKAPDVVLIATNRRDPKAMDVARVNWRSGAVEVDTTNPGDVTQWVVDSELRVRGARATLPNGSTELRVRDTARGPFRPLITASLEESVRPFGFTLDGKSLVLASSISSDTERVLEKSLKTGTERQLAWSPKSDVVDFTWNRVNSSLRAVAFEVGGRREWASLDWLFGSELELLKALAPGDVELLSTDRADAKWVVSFASDVRPPTYVLWDRKTKQGTPLGAAFPALDPTLLAPTTPVTIAARDGLALQAFFTAPLTTAGAKPPLVLLIHGGPWWRDRAGWNPQVQWLANRGAAVLQVNYRGSTGAGKRFLNAGNRQWGLAMQDDLLDAVAWAVSEGRVDASRIASMGQSYGGYATLMNLAKAPETFRCGVDLVGPANLFTLLAAVPPWWKAQEAVFHRRVGSPNDPKDRELLTAASPVTHASRITASVLIGQGANDPRVKPAESEQIVSALQASGRPVTYVLYPDEGHGLARPENRQDFAARVERFFSTCLGTRAEPLKGEREPGSTAVVAPK